MIIEIAAPIFKCKADQNIFFSRLHELTSFNKVIGKGINVYLTLTNPPEQDDFEILEEICNIWGTTFKVISNK